MMHGRSVFSLILAATATWSSASGAFARATVEGTVVDARGNPVAGAQVSSMWRWSEGEPTAVSGLAVDENGRFEADTGDQGRPLFLMAYAEEGGLAGAATIEPGQEGEVVIALQPSIHVRARFTCSDLGGETGWFTSYWRYSGQQAIVAEPQDGVVEFKAPPGEWSYFIYGSDVKSSNGTIELDASNRVHDMGEVDLSGSFIAMNRGLKVEDWTVTDARGVSKEDAQIRNYKGKWLLVEFWGHW